MFAIFDPVYGHCHLLDDVSELFTSPLPIILFPRQPIPAKGISFL
jgi:hypothetical protein